MGTYWGAKACVAAMHKLIPQCIGTPIDILIERQGASATLQITPGQFGGVGLVGCLLRSPGVATGDRKVKDAAGVQRKIPKKKVPKRGTRTITVLVNGNSS